MIDWLANEYTDMSVELREIYKHRISVLQSILIAVFIYSSPLYRRIKLDTNLIMRRNKVDFSLDDCLEKIMKIIQGQINYPSEEVSTKVNDPYEFIYVWSIINEVITN